MRVLDVYKRQAFYYLHGASTFPALRAAVLALGDLCGRTVIAELHVEDDEGHLPDGTDCLLYTSSTS